MFSCRRSIQLPQTLCHHDAFRRNLLSGRGSPGAEFILLDWEIVGHGAVWRGNRCRWCRPANYFFEAEGIAPRELDATCFASYVEGLREAG